MPNTAPSAILPLASIRHVVVGSTNPVKIAAARAVLGRVAPAARVEGRAVASTVRDQPVGDEETVTGAIARARAARDAAHADIGIGLEGGVVIDPAGTMRTCAWAAVVDAGGRESVGGSLAMPLPARVAALVHDGLELGHAMDRLTGAHATKHGAGAVGILTAGLVDRQGAYETLVAYALAPWLSPAFW